MCPARKYDSGRKKTSDAKALKSSFSCTKMELSSQKPNPLSALTNFLKCHQDKVQHLEGQSFCHCNTNSPSLKTSATLTHFTHLKFNSEHTFQKKPATRDFHSLPIRISYLYLFTTLCEASSSTKKSTKLVLSTVIIDHCVHLQQQISHFSLHFISLLMCVTPVESNGVSVPIKRR